MKKGRQIVFFLVFIIFAVLLLHHDNNTELVVEEDEIVLRLMCSHGDNSWNQTITEIVEQFEQLNPGIRIELADSDDEGMYDDFLMRQVAMDSLGDIVELRQRDFVDEGLMAPLPADMAADRDDVYERNGEIYGIGMSVLSTGISYNKEIFRMLDLEEPDTYDEFLLLCAELKRKGYTPVSVGGGTKWHMGFWLNHFYLKDVIMDNPDWPMKLQEGKAAWTDECVARMFTDVYHLFHSGYIDEDWQTISDGMMAVRLAGGKTAMVYSGHWLASEVYEQNPNIELGWFYLPDEEGRVIVRDIEESYWGISAECAKDPQRYEAAVSFLRFFYSEPVYAQFCRNMGSVSKNDDIQVVYDLKIQQEIEQEFKGEDLHTQLYLCDEHYPLDFMNKLLDIEYAMIQDQISVEEAQQMCDKAYRESRK